MKVKCPFQIRALCKKGKSNKSFSKVHLKIVFFPSYFDVVICFSRSIRTNVTTPIIIFYARFRGTVCERLHHRVVMVQPQHVCMHVAQSASRWRSRHIRSLNEGKKPAPVCDSYHQSITQNDKIKKEMKVFRSLVLTLLEPLAPGVSNLSSLESVKQTDWTGCENTHS